jgi:hypothetical protein
MNLIYLGQHWYELKYYIENRWIAKTHVLKTNLSPGEFHELDTRILHGLFTELVDFVEIDKAYEQIYWCSNKEDRKKYNVPWYSKWRLLNLPVWRCVQAGLDRLNWEILLKHGENDGIESDHELYGKPTSQAEHAQEVLKLYNWWRIDRPDRPDDSRELSGLNAFCDSMESKYGRHWLFGDKQRMTPQEESEYRRLSTASHDLKESWEQEDTDMLIRLIKIRRGLWT